ncbi:MAG: alpha/beta fold hydrolase [Hyphomicrobiaceae bacterium]
MHSDNGSGETFEAIRHGNGGNLLLLLHAAGSSPRALDRLARLLAEDVGSTLALSLESKTHPLITGGPVPFAPALDVVDSAFRADSGRGHALLGHSMGGLIGVLALLQGVTARAAVFYEPIVLSLLDPGDPTDSRLIAGDQEEVSALFSHMARGETEAGVSRFIEAYGDAPWKDLPAHVRNDLVQRAPQILATAHATSGTRLDVAAVARIEAPVLILSGSRSPDIVRRMADVLGQRLPTATRAEISGAGHMGAVTHAAEAHALVRPFLQRHGMMCSPR